MNKVLLPLKILAMVFVVLWAVGCEDKTTDVHDEHSLAEHACEHMVNGPDSAVSAVIAGTGPDISTEHTRFDITLADTTGGQKGGYVTFTPDEHAEFAIFLNKSVALTVVDASDKPATKHDDDLHLDDCSLIVAGGMYELEKETYKIYLGPTSETTVSIVIEEGGHEHDH